MKKEMKGQPSVEYLAIWGFAVFILWINLAILYQMGVIDVAVGSMLAAESVPLRIGELIVTDYLVVNNGSFIFVFQNNGRDEIRLDTVQLDGLTATPGSMLEPGKVYILEGTGLFPKEGLGNSYKVRLVVNYTDMETNTSHYFNQLAKGRYAG